MATRKNAKPEDYLFITAPRDGEVPRQLGPRAVQKAIKRYAAAALIKRDITPHTLRHTAAIIEVEGGATVAQIREQLGHANISVTNRYSQAFEAVALHLEGENPAEFGLAPGPTLLVTIEMEPATHVA